MEWHGKSGELACHTGPCMMAIWDYYYDTMVPWWEEAVQHPEKKFPATFNYVNEKKASCELKKESILLCFTGIILSYHLLSLTLNMWVLLCYLAIILSI